MLKSSKLCIDDNIPVNKTQTIKKMYKISSHINSIKTKIAKKLAKCSICGMERCIKVSTGKIIRVDNSRKNLRCINAR
jgi:hypothetical protein